MTAVRSEMNRAAARSCVTNITAMPSSRRSSWSRFSTDAASDASSAEVGSSHSSSLGGTMIARANADALPLAARQRSGLDLGDLGRQPDLAQCPARPCRAARLDQSS